MFNYLGHPYSIHKCLNVVDAFPMSETFKKSQMSEFFDVSAGCIYMDTFYNSILFKQQRSLSNWETIFGDNS